MTKNRPPHLIGAAAYSFPAVFQRGPGMLRAVLVVAVSRLLNVIQIIVVQERADREHFLIDPEMQFFRPLMLFLKLLQPGQMKFFPLP